MKQTVLFTIFFLFHIQLLKSQSCLVTTNQFSTQQQIDDFPINYPDCKEILGGVMISSSINDPITNLNGFSQIKSIGGFLFIRDNPHLLSLDGLDSLTNIGWFFTLDNNDSLSHVNALLQLDSVHQKIQIENNDVLENLSGLSNLSFIGTDLVIKENQMLPDLSGISNKEIVGELLLFKNNSLATLNGLSNLNINGNCRIISNPSLINLSVLGNLNIEKNLILEDNFHLQNLLGLENLTEIGEGFIINHNVNLNSLEGIENLSKIGGNLTIQQNNSLSNLDGFENLIEIGGSLSILNNNNLISLDGIKNIDPSSIKATIPQSYSQDIYIQDNPMLSVCSVQSICEAIVFAGATTFIFNNAPGCNFVLEIGNECGITSTLDTCLLGNSIFTTQKEIDDFPTNYPSCTVIGGNLVIEDTQGVGVLDISNIDSLQQLTTIEGDLLIQNNQVIIDLVGFQNLSKIEGTLSIGKNSITSMNGLENIETVGRSFFIGYNDSLNSLVGLDKLSSIGKDLFIFGNRKLKNLQGLDSLVHIGGLQVKHSFLENFMGLNNLSQVDGNFDIESNDSLFNFQGLENLDSIMHDFIINKNQKIEGLTGLENLKFVANNFIISNNNALTNLEALENLTQVEGYSLRIVRNNKLQSLAGLDNIELVDSNSIDYLLIQDCDSLSFCSVKSVCDFLLMGGGFQNFISNETGCNSFSEIVAACETTSVKNLDKKPIIEIFPNPSDGIFEIKMEDSKQGKISIFDMMGNLVFGENLSLVQTIDLSASPKGIYFIWIQVEDRTIIQKIILQ